MPNFRNRVEPLVNKLYLTLLDAKNKAYRSNFFSRYYRFFSIEEIDRSATLQWAFGAILLGYFVTFFSWNQLDVLTIEAVSVNEYLCWPFFQNCGSWYFLSNLPFGYSQSTLYAIFFGVIILIAYNIKQKNWLTAHMFMVILFVWEATGILLTMRFAANYWYFHITYAFIILFLANKLFLLRFIVVLFYFLAGTVKIHDGWILGTYFTSLQNGLPLTPGIIAPLITNFVIFMEIVGSWALLSADVLLRRLALFYFSVFHIFSVIFVGYTYPTIVFPLLLVLFIGNENRWNAPFTKKSIVGWGLIVVLLLLQSVSWIIPGDVKLTLEGNYLGLYMFEANHQCVSSAHVFRNDGSFKEIRKGAALARSRCNPYQYLFELQRLCKETGQNIAKIGWQFDHSINGGPFYRIVDEDDACSLTYNMFIHNDWIYVPKNENDRAIGIPVKNYFY